MTLNEYLKCPCRLSSIPYWKAKSIVIPKNVMILHHKEFRESLLNNYIDEKYFRLYHDLKSIDEIVINGMEIITASNQDIPIIVDIINKSYVDMQASCKQFEEYTKTPVHNPNLWILVKDTSNDKYIGCGIADFDSETNELILEWIQVLPAYRKKGIGQLIVNELLNRGKNLADFATVSGKINNSTKPEILYRKCGFTGNDIWHILVKR